MGADLPLITKTWKALQPFVREEKCGACECLQGALMELKLGLEDLPEGPEQEGLLSDIARAMQVGTPHACSGCEPCNPGDILAAFYREQHARATVAQLQHARATVAQPCCDAG